MKVFSISGQLIRTLARRDIGDQLEGWNVIVADIANQLAGH